MRTFRFALLIGAIASLASVVFLVAWNAIDTGAISIPFGRRRWHVLLTFVRNQDPIGFSIAVAIVAITGMLLLSFVLWQLRFILQRNAHEKEKTITGTLAELERAAPSGLTPLWVGLSIAVACFLIYVAA